MELLSLASVTKRMTTVSCVYGNMLGDMLIEIRIENKGLEITGEHNATGESKGVFSVSEETIPFMV